LCLNSCKVFKPILVPLFKTVVPQAAVVMVMEALMALVL
jgi:hypothetical protein